MKIRNYEKYHMLIIGIVILMIGELVLFLSLYHQKMILYQKIPAMVVDSKTILLTLTSQERKKL